ncbi:FxsA family protein [Pseudohalocynthiibacter sp. F2068]|uniref:FxsA family protein n=1 Tax=Pseudohalocynthiibacter sp. F2068 TaxID=2926418 RepID=UPI001FF5813A|nr:FxsA family protein [Pseudohalocynthiibacter sp. F2068]MCK0102863.1 FxsA family protein [Pseudohalocynthiibacter sp. F2068]
MWLLLAFVAVPLIEIALFIKLGGFIGLWPTLAIVVLTAFLGTWLVRNQGALAISKLRGSFAELSDPTEPLAHGAMILIAGVLLLTPGFFTDAFGFLLLFPPFRAVAYRYIRARIEVQSFAMGERSRQDTNPGTTIIDAEYTEVDPSKPPTQGSSGWTKH